MDTFSPAHILKCMQGLQGKRWLGRSKFSQRVGNRATVPTFAIWDYDLILPNGNVVFLKDVYNILILIRNIVSIPLLDKDDYKIIQENNSCTIFKDSVELVSNLNINGHYLFKRECTINEYQS